jgi:hypothetical protein
MCGDGTGDLREGEGEGEGGNGGGARREMMRGRAVNTSSLTRR